MKLFLRHEVQAQEARKTKDRRRSGDRHRARLQVEPLEGRQLLSWGSVAVPPATAHALAPLDPIQAEYAATAFERDAYGNVVQTHLGPSNPKYETNVPGVPGPRWKSTMITVSSTGRPAPAPTSSTAPSGRSTRPSPTRRTLTAATPAGAGAAHQR